MEGDEKCSKKITTTSVLRMKTKKDVELGFSKIHLDVLGWDSMPT